MTSLHAAGETQKIVANQRAVVRKALIVQLLHQVSARGNQATGRLRASEQCCMRPTMLIKALMCWEE